MNNHSNSNYRDRAEGTPLSGERLQRFERAVNAYSEFAKSWNDRTVRRQKVLSEYYGEGHAALIYQLELTVSTPKEKGLPKGKLPPHDSVLSAFLVLHKDMIKNEFVNVRNQEMVFVLNVELIQGEQKISLPSAIRFDLIDNGIANALDERLVWSFKEKLFKPVDIGIYRKLFFPLGFDGLPSYFVPSVVNCRSEVVNCIPDEQIDSGIETFRNREFYKIIKRIAVTINGNIVDTAFSVDAQFGVKVLDVLLGPCEL